MERLDFRVPASPTSEPIPGLNFYPNGPKLIHEDDKPAEVFDLGLCPALAKFWTPSVDRQGVTERPEVDPVRKAHTQRHKRPKKNRPYVGSADLLNVQPVNGFRSGSAKRAGCVRHAKEEKGFEGCRPTAEFSPLRDAERSPGTILRFTRRPDGRLKSEMLDSDRDQSLHDERSSWIRRKRTKPLKRKTNARRKIPVEKKHARRKVTLKPQETDDETEVPTSVDEKALLSFVRLSQRKISGLNDYPAYACMVLKTQKYLLDSLSPYTCKRACMPKDVRDVYRRRPTMAQISAILNYQDQMRHLLLSEYCYLSKLVKQVEDAGKTAPDLTASAENPGAENTDNIVPSGWQILNTYNVSDPNVLNNIPRVKYTRDGVVVRDRADLVQAALLCTFAPFPVTKATSVETNQNYGIPSALYTPEGPLPSLALDESFDSILEEVLQASSDALHEGLNFDPSL